jgi:hypothetical protein
MRLIERILKITKMNSEFLAQMAHCFVPNSENDSFLKNQNHQIILINKRILQLRGWHSLS